MILSREETEACHSKNPCHQEILECYSCPDLLEFLDSDFKLRKEVKTYCRGSCTLRNRYGIWHYHQLKSSISILTVCEVRVIGTYYPYLYLS